MRRTFKRGRSFGGARRAPQRQWLNLANDWVILNSGAAALVPLAQMEAPVDLTNIVSDPPEDLTILRIVGDFTVGHSGTPPFNVTFGLTVQDATWTPNTVMADADKRWLWMVTYEAGTPGTTAPAGAADYTWTPPGMLFINATADINLVCPREAVHIDIAPKVRLEPGKALYLVSYITVGTAVSMTATQMRVLYQRSGRRSR